MYMYQSIHVHVSNDMLKMTHTHTHSQVVAARDRAHKDEGVDDAKMSFWLRKKDRLVMDYGAYPHYHSYFLAKFRKDWETLPRCDIYQVCL